MLFELGGIAPHPFGDGGIAVLPRQFNPLGKALEANRVTPRP